MRSKWHRKLLNTKHTEQNGMDGMGVKAVEQDGWLAGEENIVWDSTGGYTAYRVENNHTQIDYGCENIK